jgi:hypothetical protein
LNPCTFIRSIIVKLVKNISNIAAAGAEVVKGYRLNKLKTRLGNLQQGLRRGEGFSASLYMPNYRQDWADTYENKLKERKEGWGGWDKRKARLTQLRDGWGK